MPATDRPGTGDGDVQLQRLRRNPRNWNLSMPSAAWNRLRDLPGLSRATSECKGKECSSRKGMCLSSHHLRARPVPGSAGFLHQHGLFISNHWEGMCAESCQDGKAHVPILTAAERKMAAEGKQQQKEKFDSDGLRGQWQAILVHVSCISDRVLLCCPGWSAVAQSWLTEG
nr:uncharacterized protein LOC130540651 isoform X1 [Pan paniscus]